jgi:PhoH-like ATPase
MPGDMDEKLSQWMQPYHDNLAVLMKDGVQDFLFRYKSKLSFNSLEAIRGRTLSSYCIFDETQECSLHDVKSILGRAGANSKIVFIGDQSQIESESISESNTGLITLIEKMKGQNISGHVTLQKSERSDLANLAVTLL